MVDIDVLKSQFENQCKETDKFRDEILQLYRGLEVKIDNLANNHLHSLSKEVEASKLQGAENSRNIEWTMKIQWFMLTTIVTNLIGIIYVIIQIKT